MLIDINVQARKYDEFQNLPALEIAASAREKGLDGIIFIEKNRLWPEEDLKNLRRALDGFLILRGQEVDCAEGSVLVIGVNEEIPNQISALDLKNRVESQGGCCILSAGSPVPVRNEYIYKAQHHTGTSAFNLFGAVEICNSKLSKKQLREFLEYERRVNFCALGGSASSTPGLYATKFFDQISDEKDVVRAVQKNRLRHCYVEGHDVDSRGGRSANIQWNVPKAHLMKCKGLLFDLYGTTIDLKSNESYEEFNKMSWWLAQEGIQVSGEGLMHFYKQKSSELYSKAGAGAEFPDVDILQVFREAIYFFSGRDRGREFARKAALVFRAITIKSIRLYPNTRRVLRELKRRGYRTGIISNAQAAFTIPEVEDLGIKQFFDFILLSSDIGCGKPERKIYETAARQLEISPQETAIIGDDLHGDIYAPQQMGFKTVYFNTQVGTSDFPVTPHVTLPDGDIRNLLRIFP